jgi:hypothetical protein
LLKAAVANRLGTQCPQAKFVLAKTIIQLYQIMLGSIELAGIRNMPHIYIKHLNLMYCLI